MCKEKNRSDCTKPKFAIMAMQGDRVFAVCSFPSPQTDDVVRLPIGRPHKRERRTERKGKPECFPHCGCIVPPKLLYPSKWNQDKPPTAQQCPRSIKFSAPARPQTPASTSISLNTSVAVRSPASTQRRDACGDISSGLQRKI